MTRHQFIRLGAAMVALVLAGCGGGSTASKRFEVTLQATNDDGEPLKDVSFTSGKATTSTTNAAARKRVPQRIDSARFRAL